MKPTQGNSIPDKRKYQGMEGARERMAIIHAIDRFRASVPPRPKVNGLAVEHPQAYADAPFPRKIPRPSLEPSLGSRKWKPSFAWMYEYTNQSGFTPPADMGGFAFRFVSTLSF